MPRPVAMSSYSYEPSSPASARSPSVVSEATRSVTRGFRALMKNVPQSCACSTVRLGKIWRSRARLRDSRARATGAAASSIAARGSATAGGSGCRLTLSRATGGGARGDTSGAACGRANRSFVDGAALVAAKGVGVAWVMVVSGGGTAAAGAAAGGPPSLVERWAPHHPAAAARATSGSAHATTGTRRAGAAAARVVLGFAPHVGIAFGLAEGRELGPDRILAAERRAAQGGDGGLDVGPALRRVLGQHPHQPR